MIYKNISEAKFISRPNRFIGKVLIDNKIEDVHIKNTGRCKELLIEGSRVFLDKALNTNRKTKYDLISVYKDNILINIDSQAPNKIIEEWLENSNNKIRDIEKIKREYKYGASRIDFYIETKKEKILMEVKGVTLEKNNIAMFPDAPTKRGSKHLNELIMSIEEGYKAYLVLIIQFSGAKYFTPNYDTDIEFSETLKLAKKKGVNIIALDCIVGEDTLEINKEVEVML